MIMSYRKALIVSGLALLGSLTVASAQETVRVAVPTVDEIVKASLIAADEQGFFKKRNIKVETTFYRGAGACQEALAAGAADIAVSPIAAVATAVSKGIKEKIVAVGPIVTNSGWRIMSLSDSGIKTVKDLAGKKVGISSKNSITDFYALWVQEKYGIQFQSVPIGGANVQAVNAKQLDAAVFSPMLATRLNLSDKYQAVVSFGELTEPYVPSTFVAATSFRDQKPGAVKAFVDGLFEGVRYLKKNEDYSLKVLEKVTGEKDAAVLKQVYKDIIMTLGEDGKASRKEIEIAVKLTKLAGVENPPSVDELTAPESFK